jgi:hypothetical protein
MNERLTPIGDEVNPLLKRVGELVKDRRNEKKITEEIKRAKTKAEAGRDEKVEIVNTWGEYLGWKKRYE